MTAKRARRLVVACSFWFAACSTVPLPRTPTERASAAPDESAGERRSALHVVLLYLPNRVLDLFDIARIGIEAGPGIGIDLRASHAAMLGVMTRTSAGVGLQTLRHLPLKLDTQAYLATGPAQLGASPGISWYHDFWDLRAELHLLLLGAHVAVNPMEIADFFAGLLTLDPKGDDF